MLTNFRSSCQTNLTIIRLAMLILLLAREETLANETPISADNPWIAVECTAQSMRAQILHDARRSYEPNRPTFVITHGMGGTETGDCFHQLADAICKAMPDCNVLLTRSNPQVSSGLVTPDTDVGTIEAFLKAQKFKQRKRR